MANRILEAPSTDWCAARMAEYEAGKRREKPAPWSGKIMGRNILDGLVEVPEEATYGMASSTANPIVVPEWQVWVLDFHFRDVTEARGGDPPQVPLPYKPYKQQERERMREMWFVKNGMPPPLESAPPAASRT